MFVGVIVELCPVELAQYEKLEPSESRQVAVVELPPVVCQHVPDFV